MFEIVWPLRKAHLEIAGKRNTCNYIIFSSNETLYLNFKYDNIFLVYGIRNNTRIIYNG